jgi:hypothetical protein
VNEFWETALQRDTTLQYKLNIYGFQNPSCSICEFGSDTYWWVPPKDLDLKQTYRFQLNASDTPTVFLSDGFQLPGHKVGVPAKVGGSFAVVLLVSLIMGGIYYWWQRRQNHKPWFSGVGTLVETDELQIGGDA